MQKYDLLSVAIFAYITLLGISTAISNDSLPNGNNEWTSGDTPLTYFERTTVLKTVQFDNQRLSSVIVRVNYMFRQISKTSPPPTLILNLTGLTESQADQIIERNISIGKIHNVTVDDLISYIASRANCVPYSDGMDIILMPLQFPNINRDKSGYIKLEPIKKE